MSRGVIAVGVAILSALGIGLWFASDTRAPTAPALAPGAVAPSPASNTLAPPDPSPKTTAAAPSEPETMADIDPRFADDPIDAPRTWPRRMHRRSIWNPDAPFDMTRLEAVGFSTNAAEALQQLWRDTLFGLLGDPPTAADLQAMPRPGFHEARQQERMIEYAVREALGDDGYDALLFALALPNAVEVERTTHGKGAREMGLEPGDVVIRYGGLRIFDVEELNRLHRRYIANGRSARVEIDRGGEHLELDIVLRPHGATFKGTSRPPD